MKITKLKCDACGIELPLDEGIGQRQPMHYLFDAEAYKGFHFCGYDCVLTFAKTRVEQMLQREQPSAT